MSLRLPLVALPSLAASLLITSAVQESEPRASDGGIATLYAQDDLQSSFDFRSGAAGARVFDGEVRLESAQILFDVLEAGRISYGFAYDERVAILDLGDVPVAPEVRSRDRALEYPISIFHTLSLGDEGFAIVRPGGDVDPYDRADKILGSMPLPAVRHIEACLGHTYLVRVRRDRSSEDQFFKFQIIGLIPGHSLTLRWAPVPCIQ
jgi:hypothetical protein